jgi:hypothetical protein
MARAAGIMMMLVRPHLSTYAEIGLPHLGPHANYVQLRL